jgi:hypothetical protein
MINGEQNQHVPSAMVCEVKCSVPSPSTDPLLRLCFHRRVQGYVKNVFIDPIVFDVPIIDTTAV